MGVVAFIGGLFGAVLMDLIESFMARFGISSGVSAGYIGRWVYGILDGVFVHQDIRSTDPKDNEKRLGQIFHFIIGGGVVGLFYPVFLMLVVPAEPINHLLMATLFGLITCVLPWFILLPSFGWGWFGNKTPFKSQPLISPILSHLPYGFGIGLSFVIYYSLRL